MRKENLDTSNRSRMIHLFETTSPYDFINSKYKTGNPTSSDLAIISYLLIDLNLKPGVVNVLIDYVLKINNNKLVKNFIELIAEQWSRSKIETVEDAMNFAEKEYKKNKTVKQPTRKVEKKPEWFNKEIESVEASSSEIDEINKILSEY